MIEFITENATFMEEFKERFAPMDGDISKKKD